MEVIRIKKLRIRKIARAVTGLLFTAGFLALQGCDRGAAATANPKKETPLPVRKVKVAKVEERMTERALNTTGQLVAQDRAVISSKASGRIASMPVDLGAAVREGDLLVQIDETDYRLKLRQAEAALAQAQARLGMAMGDATNKLELSKVTVVREAATRKTEAEKNYKRLENLKSEGVVSDADWEAVEAAYNVALNRYDEAIQEAQNRAALLAEKRADVDVAKQQLTDTSILAPFGGVIEDRRASPGEFLSSGAAVLTLVRIDPIRLRMEVPERDAPKVKKGQFVRLRIEGDETAHTNTIVRVSPVISATNRMLVAEADFPNDGSLRPGSFAKVEVVTTAREPALFVPKSALSVFAGIEKIFIAKNGKAAERNVVSGRSIGDQIEIKSGLAKGDLVVEDPGNLRNEQPIEF